MAKKFVWVMIALLVFTRIPHASSESLVMTVTKKTQAELGLNYTLSAVRASDTAVLVQMEIPKGSKLKTLKRVNLHIATGNPLGGSPLLSADLQTTPGKNGSVVVTFQLSPELADKCFLELITTSPPATLSSEEFYAVELKGYITDKK